MKNYENYENYEKCENCERCKEYKRIILRILCVIFMTSVLLFISRNASLSSIQSIIPPRIQNESPEQNDIQKRLKPFRVEAEDIRCLTINLFQEAAGEPLKGQEMVVQVVINRKNHLKRFGRTFCEVIKEPYQFSWTLDVRKSYMLGVKQPLSAKDFKKYSKVVLDVLERQHKVLDRDKEILYYHTTAIKPKWSKKMTLVYRIGNHLFFKEN